MAIAILKIHGMDCAEEVKALKAELGPRPGVQELAFDVLNAKMTVTYAEATATPDELIATVARTGMKAKLWRKCQALLNHAAGSSGDEP